MHVDIITVFSFFQETFQYRQNSIRITVSEQKCHLLTYENMTEWQAFNFFNVIFLEITIYK